MASTGVVLAVLQLAFALTWIIYVIYLPALAAQAGIPKEYVPWILLMDQVIFVACDWAAGVYADRLLGIVGRIGPRIAMVTLVSTAAFLALPWIAPLGSAPLFIALTVLWSATSSALRAPPLVLLGKHAAAPQRPWLVGLYLFGVGVAGAASPYLGNALKGIDPVAPFALSAITVAVVTFALTGVERNLGGTPSTLRTHEWSFHEVSGGTIAGFALAIALLAVGFQVHFAVNSAPAYLQFAKPADLEHLMPVFWIGFNLVMLPATVLTKRFGGFTMMLVAAVGGIAASYYASVAPSLDALIVAQFLVGGAWGVILMSALTAAIELGHPGREGSVTGALNSMLAVAAFARISYVAFIAPGHAELKPLLPLVPAVAWAVATLLILALAAGPGRRAGSS
jgi:hypothetical protein